MTYAAPSFPIFGLADAGPLHRWLYSFNGSSARTSAVGLAHGLVQHPTPDQPWLLVTSSEPTRDSAWSALNVAFGLLLLTVPELPERARTKYEHAAAALAAELANTWEERWTPVTWFVDGTPAPAHIVTWASAWAGFAALPGGSVEVIGTDLIDTTLDLTALTDTTAYGFDATRPFEFPESVERSAAAAWGSHELRPMPWPAHPDQQTLLNR